MREVKEGMEMIQTLHFYLPIPSTVVMLHPSTESKGHRHCKIKNRLLSNLHYSVYSGWGSVDMTTPTQG